MNASITSCLPVFAAVALMLGCAATNSSSPPAAADAAPASPASTAPSLAGHFRSPCVKTGDAQSLTLDFSLGQADWSLDYATYADATCGVGLLTVRIEGAYALTGKSATVPGAWEARFGFTKKAVTPHVAGAVDFLAGPGGCGGGSFAVGVETDVLQAGCAGLGQYPSSRCAADFDVVSLDGDALRFGDRPKDNDMCTEDKRPKALSQVISTRVK
jgi:hypothetical protein